MRGKTPGTFALFHMTEGGGTMGSTCRLLILLALVESCASPPSEPEFESSLSLDATESVYGADTPDSIGPVDALLDPSASCPIPAIYVHEGLEVAPYTTLHLSPNDGTHAGEVGHVWTVEVPPLTKQVPGIYSFEPAVQFGV